MNFLSQIDWSFFSSDYIWQWLVVVLIAVCGIAVEWYVHQRNTLWARILPSFLCSVLLLASMVITRSLGYHYITVLRGATVLAATFLVIRVIVYVLRQVFRHQYEAGAGLISSFERWIALTLWLVAVGVITGAGHEIWQWAQAFELPIGKSHINLAELIVATVSAAMTVLLALWFASLIEGRLSQAQGLEPNTRVVLSRFAKSLLLVIGVVSGLAVGGIDLTLLSVLFGALGVGLGFGLQKIAANYISGFIVLIDRGIKIGDLITVDKYYGQVTHINARFTVIRTFDGTEALIPNELLVSTPIVNHSYSTRQVRIKLLVIVGYDTDLDTCLPLMETLAQAHPRCLQDPAPIANMQEFVNDGLALELSFWIADPENGQGNVRSDIAREVLKHFKLAQIEVPYPQRVVHTVS